MMFHFVFKLCKGHIAKKDGKRYLKLTLVATVDDKPQWIDVYLDDGNVVRLKDTISKYDRKEI